MIAILSATIASCTNSAGNPAAPGANASSDSPASIAEGTWSAVIDGQPVSGKGTEGELQQTNAAYVLPDDQGKPRILFQAATPKDANNKFTWFLKIYLPDQTGSWTIAKGDPTYRTYKIYVMGANISQYQSVSLNIAVTSLSSTHVAGTFSGHFKLSVDPGNSKPLEITDGKFDMPMATSKVHPE